MLLSRLSKVITSKEAAKVGAFPHRHVHRNRELQLLTIRVWQRAAEARDAIVGLMESSLGERMKDMIEIASLATAPEAQGRGYGSALVEAIVRLVSLKLLPETLLKLSAILTLSVIVARRLI